MIGSTGWRTQKKKTCDSKRKLWGGIEGKKELNEGKKKETGHEFFCP